MVIKKNPLTHYASTTQINNSENKLSLGNQWSKLQNQRCSGLGYFPFEQAPFPKAIYRTLIAVSPLEKPEISVLLKGSDDRRSMKLSLWVTLSRFIPLGFVLLSLTHTKLSLPCLVLKMLYQ